MAVFVALKDKTVRVRRAILERARYGSQLLGSYYSRFIRATRRVAVFDVMHYSANRWLLAERKQNTAPPVLNTEPDALTVPASRVPR